MCEESRLGGNTSQVCLGLRVQCTIEGMVLERFLNMWGSFQPP